MKNLTDFRKTVEASVDPGLKSYNHFVQHHKSVSTRHGKPEAFIWIATSIMLFNFSQSVQNHLTG